MEMTAGTTAPPLLLSESDLIAEMDKTGIGTDATIAQHISTIQVVALLANCPHKPPQERNYAFKNEQQRFVPTDRGPVSSLPSSPHLAADFLLGIGIIEGYNDMGYQLNKPFLRASMEQDCQKIVRFDFLGE
jgi:DNA topoisomerase III